MTTRYLCVPITDELINLVNALIHPLKNEMDMGDETHIHLKETFDWCFFGYNSKNRINYEIDQELFKYILEMYAAGIQPNLDALVFHTVNNKIITEVNNEYDF